MIEKSKLQPENIYVNWRFFMLLIPSILSFQFSSDQIIDQ